MDLKFLLGWEGGQRQSVGPGRETQGPLGKKGKQPRGYRAAEAKVSLLAGQRSALLKAGLSAFNPRYTKRTGSLSLWRTPALPPPFQAGVAPGRNRLLGSRGSG